MRRTGLVKAYTTAEIRIVYDRGYDRLTLSGARLGADQRAEAKEQIRQLEKTLR
jgi:hypothetical protein